MKTNRLVLMILAAAVAGKLFSGCVAARAEMPEHVDPRTRSKPRRRCRARFPGSLRIGPDACRRSGRRHRSLRSRLRCFLVYGLLIVRVNTRW